MSRPISNDTQEGISSNPSISQSQGSESFSSITSTRKKSKETRHLEFTTYLESIGFVKALTQTVVELYREPEKLAQPIEYFLNRLTTEVPLRSTLGQVQSQISGYEAQLSSVMKENEFLRERLNHHERIPETIEYGGEGGESPAIFLQGQESDEDENEDREEAEITQANQSAGGNADGGQNY